MNYVLYFVKIHARNKEIIRLTDLVMSKNGFQVTSPDKAEINSGDSNISLHKKVSDIQSLHQEKVELEKKLSGILL